MAQARRRAPTRGMSARTPMEVKAIGHSGIAVEWQATDLGFPEDTRWVDASCAECGNPAGQCADEH